MDSFTIGGTSDGGFLEFFERTPADRTRPLERFKASVGGLDLTAVARVYSTTHPAALFEKMSAHWRGWEGEFAWESPEGDLRLLCTQDRGGHVSLRVALRSGPGVADWAVQATVQTEAGQLESLAQKANQFFGRSD
ncbi:MAG: DUF6228 family protein [Isosphaeraceae bacterium]